MVTFHSRRHLEATQNNSVDKIIMCRGWMMYSRTLSQLLHRVVESHLVRKISLVAFLWVGLNSQTLLLKVFLIIWVVRKLSVCAIVIAHGSIDHFFVSAYRLVESILTFKILKLTALVGLSKTTLKDCVYFTNSSKYKMGYIEFRIQ